MTSRAVPSLPLRAGGALLGVLGLIATASADPTVIDNPADPAEGLQVVEPEELWRVGGYSEDEGEFFGVVRQAAVDAAGNTYLLDQQLYEIRVFDPEGHFLRSFGRQGEGPGELTRPTDLAVMPDGRVVVLHGRPTRLTYFPPEGGMGQDVTIGDGESFGFAMSLEIAGGLPVVERTITSIGEGVSTSTQMLVALDPETGAYDRRYLEQSSQEKMGSSGGITITMGADFVRTWTGGDDGRLYVVRSRDAYEIEVYGPDGTHERTIRRDYERLPKSDEEIASEKKSNAALQERFGAAMVREIEPYHPDIESLFVRPGGELWVLSGRGERLRGEGSLGVFDVFDPDGRFVRQVDVRVPFDGEEDEFDFVGGDLFVFHASLDALKALNAGSGMVILIGDQTEEEEEDEDVQPLEIVRYSLR